MKTGQTEAFTVDERHGVWSAAHEAAGALNAGLFGSITSVSCATPGNRVAGGSYTDGAGQTQAFLVTEKSGLWSAAQQVAHALNVGGNATVNAVSCPSVGNCGAGGEYGVGTVFFDAFVVTERGGTWLAAREIAGNLNTDAGGIVESVSCTSVGDCTAGGAVTDPAGHQAFVVTGSMTQPTSTALAVSSGKVRYGHEQSERLSVTVRARYSGIPAGTVAVKAGPATICVIHLKAGRGGCALTAKKLRPGKYHLIAVYAGSAGFLGSSAARKTLTVV